MSSGEAVGILRRRDALALAGAAALAGIRPARADTKLTIWTGYPEIQPVYQAVAAEYAKTHPGVSFDFFSTSLREAEQKLTAAVPTGTGPDIFDIGSNISVNFIDNGLIEPNPPDIDAHLKSGLWGKFTVEFFTLDGKTYGLPFLEGSRASMYWNKTYFQQAGLSGPPATFPELIEAAKKLVQVDSQGRMTRSGISLRLSGQGSGIGEKFRYVLEAAGGSLIERTAAGKWHNGYDNQAGRDALGFYVDAVQTWHIDDPKVPHDADAFASGATAMLFREILGDRRDPVEEPETGLWRGADPGLENRNASDDAVAARGCLCERAEPEQGGGVGLHKVPHQCAERTETDRDDRLAVAAHGHRLEAAPGEDAAVLGIRRAPG